MTGCVLWTKAVDRAGYGVSWLDGRYIRAHRKAYILAKGAIPEGLLVRHTCDNRNCVNPEHLILGTSKDNSSDMVERGRQANGEKVGNSKFTETIVQAVRFTQGVFSSRQAAKLFGMSKTNVLDIWNNKIWKEININE